MTSREKEIIRMALIYLSANLTDACEAFEIEDNDPAIISMTISVNGDLMDKPLEDEIGEILTSLQ